MQQPRQALDPVPFPPVGAISPLESGDVERAEAVQDCRDCVMLLRLFGLVHHVVAPVNCGGKVWAG